MRVQAVGVLLCAALAATAIPSSSASGLQRATTWSNMLALPRYSKPFSAPAPVLSPHVLKAKHALQKVAALSLGRSHSEIDQITEVVNTILGELTTQEKTDAALVVTKKGNLTSAISVSTAANSTHTSSLSKLSIESDALQVKKNELARAEENAIGNKALCDTEIDYVTKMQDALQSLHGVGADSALIQLSNKLDVSNLIGRPYADQSQIVQGGIDTLRTKIEAKRTMYETAVTAKQRLLNAAQLVWDAAAATEVRDMVRRDAAIVKVKAARADLAATNVMVATSSANVVALRAVLDTLTAKLQELKDEPEKTPVEAIAMGGTGAVSSLADSINEIINELENKIDQEQLAETAIKMAKYDTRTDLNQAKAAPLEEATVYPQPSTLSPQPTALKRQP